MIKKKITCVLIKQIHCHFFSAHASINRILNRRKLKFEHYVTSLGKQQLFKQCLQGYFNKRADLVSYYYS